MRKAGGVKAAGSGVLNSLNLDGFNRFCRNGSVARLLRTNPGSVLKVLQETGEVASCCEMEQHPATLAVDRIGLMLGKPARDTLVVRSAWAE